MKFDFDGHILELTPQENGYSAAVGGRRIDIEVLQMEHGRLDLQIDGRHVTAYVSADGAQRWVTVDGRTAVLTHSRGIKRGRAGGDHRSGLAAPMPGQVRSVNVAVGEAVKKGQTLLVLEAMKMEIRIQAPQDGVVKRLLAEQGQTVDREQVLIEIEVN